MALFLANLTPALLAQATESGPSDPAAEHSHQVPADTTASSTTAASPTHGDQQEAEPTIWTIMSAPKYLTMLGLMAAGLILLFARAINLWVRLVGLAVIFVVFGSDQIFPLHPSPMCAVTKLFMFRFTHGEWFIGFLTFFLIIFVPSLIGRKLFCGWVCPLGAFQELINKIPVKWRIKQFNFTAFNAVRFMLLAMFFLTFFWAKSYMDALGAETGMAGTPLWKAYSAYSVYDPINYFEYLHWTFNTLFWITMPILVLASLALYRPFCYLICPIGALSWLLEKIAPARVRINRQTCNDCGVCVIKSPCPTIKPLLKGDSLGLPDCTSCGECIRTCPKKSISFGFKA